MDSLFGFTGKDFVVLVADCYFNYSVLRIHDSVDKLVQLSNNKLIGISGEIGDSKQFGQFIRCNVNLQRFKHEIELSTNAVARYTQNQLAAALRKKPYMLDCLLAGYDKMFQKKPQLFWIDKLASLCEMDFAVHGYGANFLWSIFDFYYKKDMDREDARKLIKHCIHELSKRFILAPDRFVVKFIGENGVEELYTVEASIICDKPPLPQLTCVAANV